ncbi:hypothetical protein [Corynebacterium terpenotabidum]|uniref:Glycosyltransferase RgtA/B/C/D-like domain-containing protein n=1 Tax=Corynebacterium terpenotabidum Y-11 TaxID=1200352 RepID=S4XGX2_9CORY|nr:hypothetical protein [Corynebacterium terpenotabidum]AGP29898.1 hypothetical protein A606_01215 [Corynebacterium terpenotabidum Y-11]
MTSATAAPTGYRWLRPVWRLVWCVLLTAVVLWPFMVAVVTGHRREALVLRDMVVPGTMALNDLATGADGIARAVPQDAVLALLSPVIPPPVTVGVIMLVCGVAGSWGASLLARRCGAPGVGQGVAAALVLWNPYVAERLLQGHWSVVAAGMLLPLMALWVMEQRRVLPVVVLAVCAVTPTGLILGVIVAVVTAGWRRAALTPLVAGLVLSLPWVVPSLVNSSGTLTDSAGAALFAARAEPFVGTLGALAGLGGIWNASAVPEHRVAWAGVLLCLVAIAVAVVLGRRGAWTGPVRRLSLLAVAAVTVPTLLATGPGLAVLGALLESVPGAGLLRDTQKFVVLALPALVVLVSRVDMLTGARTLAAGITAVLVWLQVPLLPVDLSELRPVPLDPRYAQVVEVVEELAATPGDAGIDHPRTLLWPPGNYRIIDGRPALDPLLKMLPGAPVDPGYLIVDGTIIDGDEAMVSVLSALARGEDRLAEAGIDLVLVEGAEVTPESLAVLADHDLVWSAGDWGLYRVR